MNPKIQYFLIGGLGCLAPNIIHFASQTISSGGNIPGNFMGTLWGSLIFYGIAGFLVAYILDPKDIKDAFYKGVAVPALIISLANGVSAEKINPATIQTLPVKQVVLVPQKIELVPKTELEKIRLRPSASVTAYIATTNEAGNKQGIIKFKLLPANAKGITIRFLDQGRIVAQALADTSDFEITCLPGEYTIVLENNIYYKEQRIKVVAGQRTQITVTLENKGWFKQLSNGMKNLMMTR